MFYTAERHSSPAGATGELVNPEAPSYGPVRCSAGFGPTNATQPSALACERLNARSPASAASQSRGEPRPVRRENRTGLAPLARSLAVSTPHPDDSRFSQPQPAPGRRAPRPSACRSPRTRTRPRPRRAGTGPAPTQCGAPATPLTGAPAVPAASSARPSDPPGGWPGRTSDGHTRRPSRRLSHRRRGRTGRPGGTRRRGCRRITKR